MGTTYTPQDVYRDDPFFDRLIDGVPDRHFFSRLGRRIETVVLLMLFVAMPHLHATCDEVFPGPLSNVHLYGHTPGMIFGSAAEVYGTDPEGYVTTGATHFVNNQGESCDGQSSCQKSGTWAKELTFSVDCGSSSVDKSYTTSPVVLSATQSFHKLAFAASTEVTLSDATIRTSGDLLIGSGSTIIISGDVVIHTCGQINIESLVTIDIESGASLTIYSGGDIVTGAGVSTPGAYPASDFMIYTKGKVTFGSDNDDFRAGLYARGDVILGSNGKFTGQITAGGMINVGSAKVYSQSPCHTAIPFDYDYKCSIFSDVLVSYDSINANGNNIEVCSTGSISYPDGGLNGSITCDDDCSTPGGSTSCNRQEPPSTTMDYTVYVGSVGYDDPADTSQPLTGQIYGDFIGDMSLTLDPAYTYGADTPIMQLGDVDLTGNGNTLYLNPGDYFFNSLSFGQQNAAIVLPAGGLVRIFIQGDLSIDGNNFNINEGGEPGNLFIYIGGNLTFTSNGNYKVMSAYMYVEGSVTLEPNSNNAELYGGLSAEGPININGNNPTYYQQGDPSGLGYGECSVCFDTPYTYQSGVPYTVYTQIVNDGGVELTQLYVSKAYAGSPAITDAGGGTVTSVPIDVDLQSNPYFSAIETGIRYNLGTYGETQADVIYDTTAAFVFNYDDYDTSDLSQLKVVYIADYYDYDRHYHTQIERCGAWSGTVTPVSGPFDAWDTYRSISDRNISTKIAARSFDLTLASIDTSNTNLELKEDVKVQYRLSDMTTGGFVSGIGIFDANTSATVDATFTVDGANKDLRVIFRMCADYDGALYTLYPYGDCALADVCDVTQLDQICYRHIHSRDEFAVRPDHYDVNISATDLFKAGEGVDLSFRAVDDAGDAAQDYNESQNASFTVELNVTDPSKSCAVPGYDLGYASGTTVAFADGLDAKAFVFDHIGDLNLTIAEIDGYDFASVDVDDTLATGDPGGIDRLIETYSAEFRVAPDHFDFEGGVVTEHGTDFTYLSNIFFDPERTMVTDFNITVRAEKADGLIAVNYTENCYAEPIEVTISYTTPSTLTNLDYIQSIEQNFYLEEDPNETVLGSPIVMGLGSVVFAEGDVNGTASLDFGLNFDRDQTAPVDPFELTIDTISAEDANGITSATYPVDQSATYLYGRAHAPRYRVACETASICDSDTKLVYYEFYSQDTDLALRQLYASDAQRSPDAILWYTNSRHMASDGNVTLSGSSVVSLSTPVTNGPTAPFVSQYLGTQGFPHKMTIPISTQTWLLYNRFDTSALTNDFALEFNLQDGDQVGEDSLGAEGMSGTANTSRRIFW